MGNGQNKIRIEELFWQYKERFGDSAPVFQLPYLSENEWRVLIEKAFKTGKPIEVEPMKEGVVY